MNYRDWEIKVKTVISRYSDAEWQVKERVPYDYYGNIDLVLAARGCLYVIECKSWKNGVSISSDGEVYRYGKKVTKPLTYQVLNALRAYKKKEWGFSLYPRQLNRYGIVCMSSLIGIITPSKNSYSLNPFDCRVCNGVIFCNLPGLERLIKHTQVSD